MIITTTLLSALGLAFMRRRKLRLRASGARSQGPFAARGEERILEELLAGLADVPPFYVDIGAGDGLKLSNTAQLATLGWSGVCFEYDMGKIGALARAYRDLPNIRACRTKVTPDNVVGFLDAFAVPQHFGVLSLDIDSYDHFVLEALLGRYRPTVVIAEINEKVPPPLDFTVLYDESHGWDGTHFYGQSICRLEAQARAHGYAIHALEYNNAFLVDAGAYGRQGLAAREAYQRGYLDRADRRSEFPWNRDMEDLLTLAPEQAVAELEHRFAAYRGRYALSISPGP